ncbi:hypothetical protein ACHAXT_007237 [Thalassiosira profunda]
MRLLRQAALVAAAAATAAEAFVSPVSSFATAMSAMECSWCNPSTTVSPSTALFASPPNDRDGTNAHGPSKSVGDVVQNLHGGKYQFSETQYLVGGSVAGQQFAESLYAGDGTESIVEEADEDGELPRWAARLQDWERQISKPQVGTLMFDANCREHAISIMNDERSWEKYYAFVLPNEEEGGSFRISPARGTLAPRGGASNACDATQPYSDTATILVEWVGGEAGDRLLAVGTEAESWRYHLTIKECY